MPLFPPRRCPSCQAPTIPATGSSGLGRRAAFTCPACGAQVHARAGFLAPVAVTVLAGLAFVGGAVVWAFTSVGLAVAWFVGLALIAGALDYVWPLGLGRADGSPAKGRST
ncbi:MAG: hypothetical protein PW843_01445 [Azospirillaceae bacterium]|nr:hypothetical protein [Azospirillaceae bacterium]